MSAIEVVRSEATVQVLFTVDQLRCMAPFERDRSVAFAGRFNFAQTQMLDVGDRLFWLYRKGTYKLTEKRRIAFDRVQGNEHEIHLSTAGVTDDVREGLREVWSALGDVAGESPVELDDSIGTRTYSTVAVVKMPKTYHEIFPGLDLLARHTRAGLGLPSTDPPGVEWFNAEVRANVAIGAIAGVRQTVVQPLFTSKVDDRTFFTASPLTTEQHLAMLEELCAR